MIFLDKKSWLNYDDVRMRGFIRKISYLKLILLIAGFIFLPNTTYAQEQSNGALRLFQSAQTDQKNLKWEKSLSKFRQVIQSNPQSPLAQKAHIEIGKFYKYQRDWQKAIEEYHQAIAISPHSRQAHDAKTAEAAVFYFRQDFPRALEIFKEVLSETKDWDQIKYCSYWIKAIKRKMSFPQEQSFACGKEALKIVFYIFGIVPDKKELNSLFKTEGQQVSLLELRQIASQKGLKPKVVKVTTEDLLNLDTPLIALVQPEHYVVVTETEKDKIRFIDPVNKRDFQTNSLAEFSHRFKGYALIFQADLKTAKANYTLPDDKELTQLKGGVCDCCPPSNLGDHPNVEKDGKKPLCPGMPVWSVNTVSLNLIIQDMDFSYSSRGMPVEFIRTYNGDDPKEGIFGRSWTFNYNVTLTENPDASIDLRRGDGRIDHFFWNGMNYQGPMGIYDTLTKNPDGTYSLKIKNHKTTFNFNSQGQLTSIQDRNNNTLTFTYDIAGKLTRITDPNGNEINLTYGANNKVWRLTLADGRYVSFVYDANNNLIQTTDMLGASSSFTYDSASYITSITTPHQGTTTIEYEFDREYGYALKSLTDGLGNRRSYDVYEDFEDFEHVMITDSNSNIIYYKSTYEGFTQAIRSPQGNTITFGYDLFGNRDEIRDTRGNLTRLTYDGRGNITSLTDPLNNTIILTYDADNNLIRTQDPQGNIYDFTYDAKSNLASVRDPDNQTTSFTYNSYGQLTRITDSKGQVTDFTYDTQGKLVRMTNPLGKITAYGYDTLGRLTWLTDPKGNRFTYTYDGVDHLTKIIYPDTTAANYIYNCCNLIQVNDKNGTLKFTYDALGRMASFTNYDNKIISYAYDSEDNIITLTYPDNKIVNYEYDADNRLAKVTDWLTNVTQYNYDSRGNLSFSVSPGLITIYKYDAANRLSKLINYNSNTLSITSGFEFTSDALGNRTQIRRYLPLNLPTFNLANSSYSYNSDNQLISATGKTFEYDDNGNLTKGLSPQGTVPESTYTYNYDNQLTQYTQGTTNLAFAYDSLGNRIQKTSGSTVTKYIVDPNRNLPSVLAETNASGAITAYYVYGLGLIAKIQGTSGYFYQYDGLGSTVAITDRGGNIKNKYAYDDFGSVATNSTETVANNFKYIGEEGVITDLNDLIFMRSRYFIPSLGRFTNKDPIGFEGGLNMYTYVYNNPINWVDPSGNIAIVDDIAIGFLTVATGYIIATTDWQAVGEAIRDAVGYLVGLGQRGICYFAEHTKGARPSTKNKHTKSHSSKRPHRAKERLMKEGKWYGR